jgi:N-acetyl-anhydromuramyl-L-alanine amidase AmpD
MIEPDLTSTSPHFTSIPPSANFVVIHATRSGVSNNPNELEGTLNHFNNPYPNEPQKRASAHWVIGRAGMKARVIPDGVRAWHAAEHNVGFGIELEQGVESDGFTDLQIEALVAVCRGYVKDFGVPPVHVSDLPASGFLGHQETPQGRRVGKSDPGSLFPWEAFMAELQGPPPPKPTPATPTYKEAMQADTLLAMLQANEDDLRKLQDSPTAIAALEWQLARAKESRE